jgi:fluoride exporter
MTGEANSKSLPNRFTRSPWSSGFLWRLQKLRGYHGARNRRGGLMENYVWIAAGSALGGMARYWLSGVVANSIGETFPWGTMIINILGSLVIGCFATLTGPDGRIFIGALPRQFVMIGICGGFTTFSSFSLQTLNLVNGGEWLYAGMNVVGSVVLCLVAVWLGHAIAVALNG